MRIEGQLDSSVTTITAGPAGRFAPRRGVLLVMLGFAFYLLCLLFVRPIFGVEGTAPVLVVPMAVIAWQFGMRTGLLLALLTVPLSYLLTAHLVAIDAQVAGPMHSGEEGTIVLLLGHIAIVAMVGVVGRLRDLGQRASEELSEHARTQRMLRQKKAQSQALLSALPDTIIRLGRNGELRDAKGARVPRGRELRCIEDLVPPRVAELLRARSERVMTTGDPAELEFDVRHADRITDYEARLVVCKSDEVIGILRDVSQRKRLQRELIGAREAALEAARIKTKFLANMSHEIRTPMNGVIGMTNLLRETNVSREQAEYTEIIHKSGQRLLEIIDDILDFAKIEAGKMELDEVAFDLGACVYESVEALVGQALAKDLDLATIFHDNVERRVVGDPTRLRQVLANLLSNAVKFTDQGEVLARVELLSDSPGQQLLRFTVADTGLGLGESVREHLFQPMLFGDKQGGDESRRGTGLGLAICRELVQLMGGEIGVDSSLGKGSSFWFTARLGLGKERTAEHSVPPPDPHGMRVLVVQRQPRQLIIEQLRSFGAVPETCRVDGAVERLLTAAVAGTPHTAVVVDIPRHPKVALGCVEAIRREKRLRDLPVLAVCLQEEAPSAFREDLRRAVGRMLSWPVRHDELHGALTAAMGRAQEEPSRRGLSAVDLPAATEGLVLGARVLVAEDNVVNQRVAQRTLQLLGCECVIASNGLEAVELALNGDFDVVLMDCQMPEMDGFAATQELRKRQGAKYLPIIAMTASNLKEERDRCFEAQMDDFLCKPVTLPELRSVLDRWVQKSDDQLSSQQVLAPQSEMDVPVGEAIEPEVLRKLLDVGDDDPDFVVEMIDLFLEQTPRHLEAMRTSLSVGDLNAVVNGAHSMKSSAAYLGAVRMGELCRVVESKGRSDEGPAVTRAVEALNAEYERVQKALLRERAEHLEQRQSGR